MEKIIRTYSAALFCLLFTGCGTEGKETTTNIVLADCDNLKKKVIICDHYPQYCTGLQITISKPEGACRWQF